MTSFVAVVARAWTVMLYRTALSAARLTNEVSLMQTTGRVERLDEMCMGNTGLRLGVKCRLDDKGYGQFSLIQPAQRLRLRRPLLGGDRHFFSAISMTSSSFSRPSTASTAVPTSVLLVNRGRPPPGDRPKPRSSRSIDEPSTRFLSRCSQTPCFFLDSTEFDGVLVIQRVCKTTPSSSKDLPE